MPQDPAYLGQAEPAVIESLYEQYLQNPEALDDGWRRFFEGFEFARHTYGDSARQIPEMFAKESAVLNLIGAYRQRGHLFTKTNPVRTRRKYDDPLTLESFGLSESDLNTVQVQAGRTTAGVDASTTTFDVGPQTAGTDSLIQSKCYIGIQKIGTTFSFFAGEPNGNWVALTSQTQASSLVWLQASFTNLSSIAPGNMLMGCDFIRFYAGRYLP